MIEALTRHTVLTLAMAAAVTAPLAGQQVERRGSADVAIDRRLSGLLADDPLVLSANTTIPAADTVRRSVLVLDATIILEGTILGDLVMVQGGAFIRPGAVLTGDLVNVAGGIYRSELARIGGTIHDLPTAPYRVVREPDRLVIEATATVSRVRLDGVLGLHVPTYDRVNGLTVVWGAAVRLPRLGGVTPEVHGQAGWHTQRGEPTWAADLTFRWVGHALTVMHERAYDTNERWIRGDLSNSINYLWSGRDYRDYHEVDRSSVALTRTMGDSQHGLSAAATARFQIEDARSLPAGAPWHIWTRDVRFNPPVTDGRITSAVADLDLGWRGPRTFLDGRITYEHALTALDGEHAFQRIVASGEWAMLALRDHTLEIEVHGQAVPGGGTLPFQRWSFVGGSGTLITLPFAAFHGDRVAFVETKYVVPMPERLALPILGAPALQALHSTGMAWHDGESPAFHQEVGIRLQFFALYFRYMIDPSDLDNHAFDIGVSWPFGSRYRWQRAL